MHYYFIHKYNEKDTQYFRIYDIENKKTINKTLNALVLMLRKGAEIRGLELKDSNLYFHYYDIPYTNKIHYTAIGKAKNGFLLVDYKGNQVHISNIDFLYKDSLRYYLNLQVKNNNIEVIGEIDSVDLPIFDKEELIMSKLRLTGNKSIAVNYQNQVVKFLANADKIICIPNSCVGILQNAANYNESIQEIVLGANTNYIDKLAFKESSLMYLRNTEVLKKLGESCFANSGISEFTIGKDLEAIPKNAFFCCGNLKYIKIPSNIKSIGERAFALSGLEEVEIEEGLEHIHLNAFHKTEIKELKLPESLLEFENFIFGLKSDSKLSSLLTICVKEKLMDRLCKKYNLCPIDGHKGYFKLDETELIVKYIQE